MAFRTTKKHIKANERNLRGSAHAPTFFPACVTMVITMLNLKSIYIFCYQHTRILKIYPIADADSATVPCRREGGRGPGGRGAGKQGSRGAGGQGGRGHLRLRAPSLRALEQ